MNLIERPNLWFGKVCRAGIESRVTTLTLEHFLHRDHVVADGITGG
jgi:hypothetical protein